MSKRPPKEKQSGEKPADKIAISESRSPKKKQADIFARLILPPHPFEDLPAREELPNVVPFGYPTNEDAAIQIEGNPENLDIQSPNFDENVASHNNFTEASRNHQTSINAASQSIEDVASQHDKIPASHTQAGFSNLDIQNEFSPRNSDIRISKNHSRISKETDGSDIQISKDESLDIQKSQKSGSWQKYDEKRKSKGLFIRPDEEITRKFRKFCIDQGWELAHATELAWRNLMESLDIQKEQNLDIRISLDDRRLMRMFKTKPIIINHYLRYNEKNKWTTKDDEAAAKFNEVDLRIIELGFIQTQINAGLRKKINSFSYYVNEIEMWLAAELSEETLDGILKVHRIRWSQMTGKVISQE